MTRDTFDMFSPPERGRFGDNESAGHKPRGRVTGASDLVDLTLSLMQEKPLAIAVRDPAKSGSKWVWLPKSIIDFEIIRPGIARVTMPEQFAQSKGLI